MRWLGVLVVLAGCIHSKAVECNDGRLCPPDTTCVPNGCARTGDCGDGRVDDGEECDDENLTPGDGCSSTCTIEVCGNGVVDPGEECDDENAMSHDGCSSGCLAEQPVWTQVMGAGPSGRRGHVAAWDPDHGVGILHGGTDTTAEPDTWSWNGGWTRVADGPVRTFHAIASDRAGRLVMFGGTDAAGTKHAETFVWNGNVWSGPLAGTAATARFDHVMGPDVVSGQVVMYGGQGPVGIDIETWVLKSTGWVQVLPGGPLKTQNVRFTFEPTSGLTVSGGGTPTTHDTFQWDGATWTRHDDPGLQRVDHVQDYDPARRRIVAFAGQSPTDTNEVDEWDGAWVRLSVVGTPPPIRTRAAGFYDPIRHALVIFGGAHNTIFLGDTWTLKWTSSTPDDACDGMTDLDGDQRIGCDDPDCWARCTPRCPPGTTCDPASPQCGDSVCNPALETPALCPVDC